MHDSRCASMHVGCTCWASGTELLVQSLRQAAGVHSSPPAACITPGGRSCMGGYEMRQLVVNAGHRGHMQMRGLAGTASGGTASQAGVRCASSQCMQAMMKTDASACGLHHIKGRHQVQHLAGHAGRKEGMCSCTARQARQTQPRSYSWQAAGRSPTSSAACLSCM